MGFLIGLVAKLVGERVAPALTYAVLLVGLAFAILWLRADAYKDGERATDDKWVEAGERLEEQAAAAGEIADGHSAERIADENGRVREEKEKLDEAEAAGTSPLDVLFGA